MNIDGANPQEISEAPIFLFFCNRLLQILFQIPRGNVSVGIEVEQYHFKDTGELLEKNMARGIDGTSYETREPEVEEFGCTVRDIYHGGHATEDTAKIVKERV